MKTLKDKIEKINNDDERIEVFYDFLLAEDVKEAFLEFRQVIRDIYCYNDYPAFMEELENKYFEIFGDFEE